MPDSSGAGPSDGDPPVRTPARGAGDSEEVNPANSNLNFESPERNPNLVLPENNDVFITPTFPNLRADAAPFAPSTDDIAALIPGYGSDSPPVTGSDLYRIESIVNRILDPLPDSPPSGSDLTERLTDHDTDSESDYTTSSGSTYQLPYRAVMTKVILPAVSEISKLKDTRSLPKYRKFINDLVLNLSSFSDPTRAWNLIDIFVAEPGTNALKAVPDA